MILIVIKKIISSGLFVNKTNNLGNYIEGTSKKFPSTNFSHFPTHSCGLQYLLLLLCDHSVFFFPFLKFQHLFNLQWLTGALFSLFSHLFLLLLLYFLSHTGFASCLHLSLFFFFISQIEDPVAVVLLLTGKKNPKCMSDKSLILVGICRNRPKCLKCTGIGQNFLRSEQGGISFRFVDKYEIFRPFQSKWNRIHNIEKETLFFFFLNSGPKNLGCI